MEPIKNENDKIGNSICLRIRASLQYKSRVNITSYMVDRINSNFPCPHYRRIILFNLKSDIYGTN